MILQTKNILPSINKAFLAQNILLGEFENFKKAYITLCENINEAESEETLKDYINVFLRNTHYPEKFTIKENVNNIDLVIYNPSVDNPKIGVIIETKALKNNAEMITKEDINKKAFQELVLYYSEERISNSNFELKHLIITNSKEWFIFNASEFERIFYQDKQFNKTFTDWKSGKLVNKNKDWFYSEVAKPFIENSQETIVCTHFQLCQSSETLTKLNENELIPLFKIFSPEHLLKLPFANDSNTLNQDFYNEILHIIGLYETQGTIKKIERLKPKERNSGSFLENVISLIENDDLIEKLKKLPEFELPPDIHDDEELLFSISLELCLTWINRVIFIKLLENQLYNFNNKDKDFLFLNIVKIQDFETLRELFFDILAVIPAERKPELQKKYSRIPYLNSSLFEQTLLEKECVKINHLKHNAQIPIFAATVLKDENGKRTGGSLPLLQYLFEFLDSYNFASINKTEIREKDKTLINSSVLGLIFEKLNGYKEGSFFTPGYVTMYICRETVRNTVVEKFRSANLQGFENLEGFNDLYNKIGKIPIKKANEIFNNIHICDPAVGSGHFLVSALNELIAIKSELGILCDGEGKILRNVYCEVQNDELYIAHFDELFVYNFHDKVSQKIQETIFNEKRTLIENCLFGVDINPKSVQICTLRLWIELLKNAYYIKGGNLPEFKNPEDYDLQTLPNIDINIKCGNSLVSFFTLNGNSFNNGQLSKIQRFTEEYKTQVGLYKHATEKKAKKKIVDKIKSLKQEFMQFANPNDEDYMKLKKKESEHGYMPMFFSRDDHVQWQMKQKRLLGEIAELTKIIEEKNRTLYSNAFEWRFEFPEVLDENGNFTGFDAIVGNPPYFSLAGSKKNVFYSKNYQTFEKGTDIYCLFIEKALQLLKKNRYFSFIVSNKWLTTRYGEQTRNFLLENTDKLYILNFNKYKIFEKATVDTAIISAINADTGDKIINIANYEDLKLDDIEKLHKTIVDYKQFKPNINELWNTSGFSFLSIKNKVEENSVKLGEVSDIQFFRGITTGFNEAFVIDDKTKNKLISENPKCSEIIKPLLRGRDIDKFSVNFQNLWIINIHNGLKKENIKRIVLEKKYPNLLSYLGQFQDKLKIRQDIGEEWYNLRNCTYLPMFEKPKIVFTKASKQQAFAYDTDNYYLLNTSYFISGENLKYLLGLLNSKLMNFCFKKFYQSGGIEGEISLQAIENFPIKFSEKFYKKITELVDKIIENKKQNKETKKLEQEIDKTVYKIYGLSKEEIQIIENETA